MDNRYFVELNGYLVKDKEAREDIEVLNKLISNANYHFINTGTNSGDCILLELPTKNYLVDLSNNTNISPIVNYLDDNNISKIDGIIISNDHGDHCGGENAEGFIALVNSDYVDINTVVYLPTDPDYTRFTDDETNVVSRLQNIREAILNACTSKGLTVEHMETNDTIEDNGVILRFLNSDTDTFENYYDVLVDSNNDTTTHTNYNNFTMVVQVENLNNTTLLTGDIEYAAQTQLEKYLKRKITLKKIEHHGVNHLSDSNYLKKSSSNINVVMNTIDYDTNSNAGKYDSFSYIIKNGDKLYSTQDNGTMLFIDNGYSIKHNENLINEEFNYPNGVVGMIASGTNTFRNLGEVSYRNIIKTGDDLNDYTTTGDYVSASASVTSTLDNVPFTSDGFKLTVEYNINKNRIYQKIFRNNKNIEIYYRYYDANGWNNWNLFTENKHAQATLTTATTLSGSNDYIKIPFNNLTHGKNFELTEDGGIHALSSMLVLTGGFVILSGINVDDNINIGVFKNNTRIARFQVKANASDISLPVPQIMTSVTSSDTLYLYVRNQTSSTSTITVNNSFNVINV